MRFVNLTSWLPIEQVGQTPHWLEHLEQHMNTHQSLASAGTFITLTSMEFLSRASPLTLQLWQLRSKTSPRKLINGSSMMVYIVYLNCVAQRHFCQIGQPPLFLSLAQVTSVRLVMIKYGTYSKQFSTIVAFKRANEQYVHEGWITLIKYTYTGYCYISKNLGTYDT
jgi:hypothetical protein